MRIFTNFNFVKIRTCSSSGLALCVELWTKQVSYRISVPRSYANFQVFAVFHVFKSLIEGFRSWEYRIRYQLDLLYILNCSNPKNVSFSIRKSYFSPESRPAGAFWANSLISCESKVACKFSKKCPRVL